MLFNIISIVYNILLSALCFKKRYHFVFFNNSVHPSIHPSMYLLAKCQHNANNNAIDNAKWSTEQKRETLC